MISFDEQLRLVFNSGPKLYVCVTVTTIASRKKSLNADWYADADSGRARSNVQVVSRPPFEKVIGFACPFPAEWNILAVS